MQDDLHHRDEVLGAEVHPERVLGVVGQVDKPHRVFQLLVGDVELVVVDLFELHREERVALLRAHAHGADGVDPFDLRLHRDRDLLLHLLGGRAGHVDADEHPVEGDLAHQLAGQLNEGVRAYE